MRSQKKRYHGYYGKNGPLGGAKEKCIAFCRLHKCNVTAKQMRKRHCLEKHCKHFAKKKDHPYWSRMKGVSHE